MSPLHEALACFDLDGDVTSVEPLGAGNIHDTYRVRVAGPGSRDLVFQRLNTAVFPDPDALMENLDAVLDHLQDNLARSAIEDPVRRSPTLIRARDRRLFHRDDRGHCYRLFLMIPDAESPREVRGPGHARQVGRALGEFQGRLADFDPRRLRPTLPGFHDIAGYWRAFEGAVARADPDRSRRAAGLVEDLQRERARIGTIDELRKGDRLPIRVVHWDPKVDNVLICRHTGEALCLIDLDTVAPSVLIDDVGDLVRSAANPHGEDAPDPDHVEVDLVLVRALLEGFLEAAGSTIRPVELESVADAPAMMALELGLRFLTDYLAGDRYFKVRHPEHNLHRARVQAALRRSFDRHRAELDSMVRAIGAGRPHRAPADAVVPGPS